MERGLIPDDVQLVGGMVRDICYYNAKQYLNFRDRAELQWSGDVTQKRTKRNIPVGT